MSEGSPSSQHPEVQEPTAEKNPILPFNLTFLSTNEEEPERSWGIDDDVDSDPMALIVLDDMPHEVWKEPSRRASRHDSWSTVQKPNHFQTISEILRANEEKAGKYLWLADTYDTIPDYSPTELGLQGTLGPIDSNWRSPFVGFSVEAAAAFIDVLRVHKV